MNPPRPREEEALDDAHRELSSHGNSRRLDILEGVAAVLGGFDLEAYRSIDQQARSLDIDSALEYGERIVNRLSEAPLHPSLALSALARPPLNPSRKRTTGSYYTDWRLAEHLANSAGISAHSRVVDPACGTGMLLVASVLSGCGDSRQRRAKFIQNRVSGADTSQEALRGATLSLASLTENLDSIAELRPRLRAHDSLLVGPEGWADIAPDGFDVVVGNPPWEKLKVSRHEHLVANGIERHYGDDYVVDPESEDLSDVRARTAHYASRVAAELSHQGSGEPDLYKLFVELSMALVADRGVLALLVPAGLIRSKGTENLRNYLLEQATRLSMTVFHNHARFFAIDTRFKFLSVTAEMGRRGRREPLQLRHGRGDQYGVEVTARVALGRKRLRHLRPDGSVPEVRSQGEWAIFRRMHECGVRLGDPSGPWQPQIVREVDMTLDRRNFLRQRRSDTAPVIEGRMIAQYRFGAKRYVAGTGRSAIWEPVPPGSGQRLSPQFHMPRGAIPSAALARVDTPRVGFCDITGQTNERTMVAAPVPAGVVCGNKVPTVRLGGTSGDCDQVLKMMWLGVANSLVFDWLLRRVVTTTINYFLLLGLPFPTLEPTSLPALRLAELVEKLTTAERVGWSDPWEIGRRRAAVDALVARAYGLDGEAFAEILNDFPLLDRGQPSLAGETRSTVTADTALAAMDDGTAAAKARERRDHALEIGAVPYLPAEFARVQPFWAGVRTHGQRDAR